MVKTSKMTYQKFVSEVFVVFTNPNVADKEIYKMVLEVKPDLRKYSWSNSQIISLAAKIWKKHPDRSTQKASPKSKTKIKTKK